MSLSNYLASKYLNAEPSSSSSGKKRKRKGASSAQAGLIIADDDALGWNPSPTNADEDTEGRPLTVTSGSAEFRKAKKNAWKVVGTPALQPTVKEEEGDAAAADRIIAEAASENAAAMKGDEEPVVEGMDVDDGVVKMGDGTHAGLQSAADVGRQFEKRKREEAAAWEREQRG
ncbi:hypothetical protein G7Y89_g15627 [Cudoniella acicularis]|uniref:Uncharacterized protein n=1 Tax=Cudoniella acicularis TaxID=354080 RepID=A0A8H4QIH9_9HELO|nr:hypothetical protein G7Y89_g15627 [Cudoniella acicularis]